MRTALPRFVAAIVVSAVILVTGCASLAGVTATDGNWTFRLPAGWTQMAPDSPWTAAFHNGHMQMLSLGDPVASPDAIGTLLSPPEALSDARDLQVGEVARIDVAGAWQATSARFSYTEADGTPQQVVLVAAVQILPKPATALLQISGASVTNDDLVATLGWVTFQPQEES